MHEYSLLLIRDPKRQINGRCMAYSDGRHSIVMISQTSLEFRAHTSGRPDERVSILRYFVQASLDLQLVSVFHCVGGTSSVSEQSDFQCPIAARYDFSCCVWEFRKNEPVAIDSSVHFSSIVSSRLRQTGVFFRQKTTFTSCHRHEVLFHRTIIPI